MSPPRGLRKIRPGWHEVWPGLRLYRVTELGPRGGRGRAWELQRRRQGQWEPVPGYDRWRALRDAREDLAELIAEASR